MEISLFLFLLKICHFLRCLLSKVLSTFWRDWIRRFKNFYQWQKKDSRIIEEKSNNEKTCNFCPCKMTEINLKKNLTRKSYITKKIQTTYFRKKHKIMKNLTFFFIKNLSFFPLLISEIAKRILTKLDKKFNSLQKKKMKIC